MTADIIWLIAVGGCGVLFYLIGVYAQRKKTPMHFFAGTTVKSEEITDVKAYNRANACMWKVYSLVYLVSALIWILSETAALVLMLAGGIGGIFALVWVYMKIEKKYRVQNP